MNGMYVYKKTRSYFAICYALQVYSIHQQTTDTSDIRYIAMYAVVQQTTNTVLHTYIYDLWYDGMYSCWNLVQFWWQKFFCLFFES